MQLKSTVLIGTAVLLAGSIAHAGVNKTSWGRTADGKPVEIFTLSDRDLTVRITTFGARVVSIEAPDRSGKKADVVLGYDKVSQYEADKSTYFGAIVGRYGNRIAKGTFTINGETFHVPLNDKANALHGGPIGFDHKVWTGQEIPNGVEMTLVSPDGDMGFPGTLTAHVRYTVEGESLHIDYSATTTKPTVFNLTNHSYFNLAGDGKGTILDEVLTIPADRYTPVDAGLIPTSELAPVAQTPFDFRTATAIGRRIDATNEQLKRAGGYDHNFVLNGKIGELHLAAHAYDPSSGRTLTIRTTEPGVQFYSGNFLDGTKTGKFGVAYSKHAGFCLETQHFPDSPNEPKFPSTLLKPGQTMHSETVFTFGVQR
ncbi:aldose epimerase family protein [Granulicella mallensis]|uniref:Aldose 1-epimerase n=1 Tax=Granulicella mallensis (strain ATCC BAA-1857 / DSM 23137 / MP5ACTX8) TaxID=682795 RepID=G8NPX0_GRAMM|nr:aldose epimerase family protein [Granulicella mallensis]AEU37209.1 Aldose 1-epimerase [Granulicella mallensis MP5ACTX8]